MIAEVSKDGLLCITDRGSIDARDCAFPQVAITGGDGIVCSYSDAGGQFATGGSSIARSLDGGRTWTAEGQICTPGRDAFPGALLRTSSLPGQDTVYAYGGRALAVGQDRFGEREVDAILLVSTDGAHSWSEASTVPMPTKMLEISHGVLPLPDGRILAPAATIEPGRLGAEVLIAISDDGGHTWPGHSTAMSDPRGESGYLEQKLAYLGEGRILATAWTVTLAGVRDQPNSFAISHDRGETWSSPGSIGTRGQTLSVLPLGDDRLLILYNRRYGRQGIVAALTDLKDSDWPIHSEIMVYEAEQVRNDPLFEDGVDEMLDFTFGFPTAVRLPDGDILVTYWAGEYGRTSVRWARLSTL